ncbi:MAG: cysteine--tRNA ligase [Thermoplasmata archaeon]|nr:cysteine--tRNA ligase [Thermoplasmata archaeon]
MVRAFRVYDTLAGEVRPFVPRIPPRVGLFVCGLTPYAEAHIGHGRTAITFDVVARALRRWGYRVLYVQNVTNLDDRLIVRGQTEGRDPLELAEFHFQGWLRSMDQLEARSVNVYPFATDYMPEIIDQISTLLQRGFAYAVDGDVYYSVAKFPDYGRLSGQRVEALRPGARIEVDPKKRASEDFALWKSAKPGEPAWPSPWGAGRPGWHVEDTAITARLLGNRYDLHGGGTDLKFPHHEAEIAQAEGASGEKPLVNYWMHAGMLQMHGEKMAKSVGNVVGLDETIRRVGAEVLRFYYLNANYRSPLNYEEGKSLEEAREGLATLSTPYRQLREEIMRGGLTRPGRELPPETAKTATELPHRLDEILAEDFQTREAIAALYGWGRMLGEWGSKFETLSGAALVTLGAPYRWATEVLGLFPERASGKAPPEFASLVQVTLEARSRARARGDFGEADHIRQSLLKAGIVLEDHGTETRWQWKRDGSG